MKDLTKTAKRAGAVFQAGVMATAVAVITGGAVAAQDLSEFPNKYIAENGEIETAVVVGDNAETMDTVGAINIVESISNAANNEDQQLNQENIETDRDYNEIGLYSADNVNEETVEKDMILVGGPSVNSLVQELSEHHENVDQHSEFEQNQAVIQVVEDAFENGQDALIVAGYDSEATMNAANFLAEHHENQDRLDGEAKVVINTEEETGVAQYSQLTLE